MSIPLRRPVTYEEFCRQPDDGRQYEIYDGVVVVNPSPFWPHQDFLSRLTVVFHGAIRDGSRSSSRRSTSSSLRPASSSRT